MCVFTNFRVTVSFTSSTNDVGRSSKSNSLFDMKFGLVGLLFNNSVSQVYYSIIVLNKKYTFRCF